MVGKVIKRSLLQWQQNNELFCVLNNENVKDSDFQKSKSEKWVKNCFQVKLRSICYKKILVCFEKCFREETSRFLGVGKFNYCQKNNKNLLCINWTLAIALQGPGNVLDIETHTEFHNATNSRNISTVLSKIDLA